MARNESSNPALQRGPFAQGGRPVGFERPSYGAGPGYAPDPVEQAYYGPTATSRDTGRMTIEDVVVRTGVLLGTILLTGGLTWALGLEALLFPAMLVGLVLGLVISFKQITNPVAVIGYAAVEGVFLGGLTKLIENRYPGIAVQAVTATAAVSLTMLFVYRSGRLRVTPRFTRIVVGATLGYMVLLLANLVASLFVGGGLGLFNGGVLGIAVSLFAVGLASLNLVLDYDQIAQGARNGVPERFGWYAAFSLTVTLVWLYVEMLRLISQLRE
jgi:uncharacterized YccA/Bax inhibitor family protein